MSAKGIIADLLFQDFRQVEEMAKAIHKYAFMFLPGVFFVAILIEYFHRWDFISVVKKLIIALIALSFFPSIHKISVEYSLEASSTFIQTYSKDNVMLKNWKQVLLEGKGEIKKTNESMTDFFVSNVKYALSDVISRFIWIIALLMLFILKQIYSFVYYFTYIFYPICALLSFFPVSEKSLGGAIKGSLWCILMPFVLSLMMSIVGNIVGDADANHQFVVTNISSLIQLLVACLMILATASITQKLIEGTGLGQVAGQLGQMASMIPIMGAAKFSKTGLSTISSAGTRMAMKAKVSADSLRKISSPAKLSGDSGDISREKVPKTEMEASYRGGKFLGKSGDQVEENRIKAADTLNTRKGFKNKNLGVDENKRGRKSENTPIPARNLEKKKENTADIPKEPLLNSQNFSQEKIKKEKLENNGPLLLAESAVIQKSSPDLKTFSPLGSISFHKKSNTGSTFSHIPNNNDYYHGHHKTMDSIQNADKNTRKNKNRIQIKGKIQLNRPSSELLGMIKEKKTTPLAKNSLINQQNNKNKKQGIKNDRLLR